MHLKKTLSIGLITTILLSLLVAFPVTAPPVNKHNACAIWVDPTLPDLTLDTLQYCDTFTVNIYINMSTAGMNPGATGLYAWEFKLYWENAILNCTSAAYFLPDPTWNAPNNFIGGDGIRQNYNGTHGRYWRAISAMPVQEPFPIPFVGVMIIVTLNFHVIYPLGSPDHVGGLIFGRGLELATGDDTGAPFPTTPYDGNYHCCYVPPPKPKLEVLPTPIKGVCGQKFNVTIAIKNLAPAWNMCGWEAKLSYNTTMLDALNSYEGPFLPSFAGPNGTHYINKINDTAGVVHSAGVLLGTHTVPYGTGVLSIIEFNASWQYTVPPGVPPVTCVLHLYDTIISDCEANPIDHNLNDGEYEAPYKTLGWALDCWTDPYRKLGGSGNSYYTQFTGVGQSYPGTDGDFDIINDYPGTGDWISTDPEEKIWVADCYEPQEFVKLYALLTYNQWPEQNKIVAFEIYGPRNDYWNISIIRTAITNASGVATINFTIPHPCENLEDIVFGKWVCYQMAQVKDPWEPERYRKVVDVLMWDVGWKVQLLAVTASDAAVQCGYTRITIYYKNIAMMPMHVCWTFSLFDTLLDPIGELVIPCDMVPAGAYCHPYYDNKTVQLHIPKWAHVGPCAHVYVNAFTALPMQCGLPYCPEVIDHFTITLPP